MNSVIPTSDKESLAAPPRTPLDRVKVVALLCHYWDETDEIGSGTRERTRQVIESYNHILPEALRSSKASQTKCHIGWSHRAINAYCSRLVPMLVPSITSFFNIYDPGQTYADSCSVMLLTLQALCKNANFKGYFRKMVKTRALEGAVGADVAWDTMRESLNPNKTPTFKFIQWNPIDVGLFPVTEPKERAVFGTRSYLTKQELIAQAMADPTQSYDMAEVEALPTSKDSYDYIYSNSKRTAPNKYGKRLGMEVFDFYAPELVVEDQIYYRVFATIANNKLIRFVTADEGTGAYDCPIFSTHDELYVDRVGEVRIGVGLCHGAYDLELAAMTVNNLTIDNLKDIVKPARLFDATDPYIKAIINRAAGIAAGEYIPTASGNPNHMRPLVESGRSLPLAQEILAVLQYQYESAVGIPNFLSGVSDTDDRRVSATAKRLEANGADVRIREYAEALTDELIDPLIRKMYTLVANRINTELQTLQQVMQQFQQEKAMSDQYNVEATNYMVSTGQQVPMAPPPQPRLQLSDLPMLNFAHAVAGPDFESWLRLMQPIPPISSVTLTLSTFESAVEKTDIVNNSERALMTLGQVAQPAPQLLSEVELPSLVRGYLNSLNLGENLKPASQALHDREQAEAQAQQDSELQRQLQMQDIQIQVQTALSEIQKTQIEIEKEKAEVQKIQAETAQLLQLVAQGPPPHEKPEKKASA